MNSNYRVTNEDLAKKQFEQFMKEVYDKADKLSLSLDEELFSAFTKLASATDEVKYDSKIANKVIDAANNSYEYGSYEFFDAYSVNELKQIAKDNHITLMPKSNKNDIITAIMEGKISYSKLPSSKKVTSSINRSVDKYLNKKDSTYLGLSGEITKYTNKVMSKLNSIDKSSDPDTYEIYYGMLESLNKLSLEINKFKKYSDLYAKKFELISLYKKEIEKYDGLINDATKKMASASSDVEKVFIRNQIKSYEETKKNYQVSIDSYTSEITTSIHKDLNGGSASEYSEYLNGLVDNVWNNFRKGFASDTVSLDVDPKTYKMYKESYSLVKDDISSIFSKVVNKENELNELCEKYGISRETESIAKEEILEDDVKTELPKKEEVKEEVKTTEESIIDELNKVTEPTSEKESVLPGIPKIEKEEKFGEEPFKYNYVWSILAAPDKYSVVQINAFLNELKFIDDKETAKRVAHAIVDQDLSLEQVKMVKDRYLSRKFVQPSAQSNEPEVKEEIIEVKEEPIVEKTTEVVETPVKEEVTDEMLIPTNDHFNPEIDKVDEEAQARVNAIKNPVLIKPSTFGSRYSVYGATEEEEKELAAAENQPVDMVEEPAEEYGELTNKDKFIIGINNAGDKFVDKINKAGDKLVGAAEKVKDKFKEATTDENGNSKPIITEEQFKVILKNAFIPGYWATHKIKALNAAVKKKIHNWAVSDFEQQFNEVNSEDRGVTR